MGDDAGGFRIVKIGDTSPPTTKGKTLKRALPSKKPKFGILKGGKTARSKPRFEGVRDPARAPPLKRASRLRILTEKGAATRRAKIASDSKRRPIREIRNTLRKYNLTLRENTPEHLTRKIYQDAQEAGMISST